MIVDRIIKLCIGLYFSQVITIMKLNTIDPQTIANIITEQFTALAKRY